MPRRHVRLETALVRTPRLAQVEGMFDLRASEVSVVEWEIEVPGVPGGEGPPPVGDAGSEGLPTAGAENRCGTTLPDGASGGEGSERDWSIGLIVGPSGSGKSTIARACFGARAMEAERCWPLDRAIIDAFPEHCSVREITDVLVAVGFASPPAWLRPWSALSTGQKFRAEMARRILEERALLVVDEFTSVVDRTVARTVAHCVGRAIRRRGARFVAVSCHYDIIEWLQPDWVLDMADGRLEWRSVQPRPPIRVEIRRVHHHAWRIFRAHHYLSSAHLTNARCYCMFWNGEPIAFLSFHLFPHPTVRNLVFFHRLVVLPDHQGLGLAMRFLDTLASMLKATGRRSRTPTSHPGLRQALARSRNWRMTRAPRVGRKARVRRPGSRRWHDAISRRRVAIFEYCGPPWPDRGEAEAIVGRGLAA